MPRRIVLIVVPLIVALTAGLAATRLGAEGPKDRVDPVLLSGGQRYAAYVRAERDSMRAMVAAGDASGARIHRERLRPESVAAGLSADTPHPLKVASAASRVLSLDARIGDSTSLLDIESHAAGAGAAFDAVRDALWARDKGLVGSIDDRLAGLRTELDRHRRGTGFRPPRSLRTDDRRRLAAALDALAWRLTVAVEKLSAP